MASSVASLSAFLKETYTTRAVEDLTQKDQPFLAEIPKDEDLEGSGHVVPIIQTAPQGVASLLATAQTNATNIAGRKFTLTAGDISGSVSIGLKAIRASRTNKGAFFRDREQETNAMYEQVMADLCHAMWSTGGQTLGRISAINGEVVTLENKQDAANFEIGMNLCGSANDGSDAAHTLIGTYSDVTLIDRVNGLITMTDASNAVGTDADAYLFRYGMFYGNTTHWVLAGVPAFIAASESPAVLYGMTRTSDPVGLAGCRVLAADVTGKSFEQRIRFLGAKMAGTYRARGTWTCWLHPEDFETLSLGLAAQGNRIVTDTSTRFGFQKIDSTIGGRPCRYMTDTNVPIGTAWVLDMPSWSLLSMGPLVSPVQEDGLVILRNSTTNDFEYRVVGFPSMVTRIPKNSGRVSLT